MIEVILFGLAITGLVAWAVSEIRYKFKSDTSLEDVYNTLD